MIVCTILSPDVEHFDPLPSDDFANPQEQCPTEFEIYKPVTDNSPKGCVYTFGTGDCEQLGHTDGELTIFRPERIDSLVQKGIFFVRIAVGGLHNLGLTSEGTVWSWGCDDDCVLGRKGEENTPLPVEGLNGIRIGAISAGDCHSAAVDTDGDVWVWGTYKGQDGYIGFASDMKKQERPVRLSEVRKYGKAVDVSSGENHTAVLLEDGKAVIWGFADQGQLGKPITNRSLRGNRGAAATLRPHPLRAYDPDLISNPPSDAFMSPKPSGFRKRRRKTAEEKFTSVTCVGNSTYMTCASGRAFACGLNNYGQLGTGDKFNRMEPTEISSLRNKGGGVLRIAGGTHHALALCKDGSVYAMGRGDSGQLGLSRSKENKPPAGCATVVPLRIPQQFFGGSRILQVEAGGCFSVALAANNEIYAWGYGEMGQLGNVTSSDTDTVPDDEVIPYNLSQTGPELNGVKVLQVGAGGQHTAILGEDSQSRKGAAPPAKRRKKN